MNALMHVLALTGGIATGKSTWVRILGELLPSAVVFDCDASVDRWLASPEVIGVLLETFGPAVGDGRGGLSRPRLRELAFAEPEVRSRLEEILHPRVREECLEFRAQTARQGLSPLFVADVPLLFESSFEFGYERSLLVATTRDTQVARLRSRNGYDDAMAEAMLRAQWPIDDKIPLADVVFWNEGPLAVLQQQLLRYLHSLELMSDDQKPKAAKKKSAPRKSATKAAKKSAKKSAKAPPKKAARKAVSETAKKAAKKAAKKTARKAVPKGAKKPGSPSAKSGKSVPRDREDAEEESGAEVPASREAVRPDRPDADPVEPKNDGKGSDRRPRQEAPEPKTGKPPKEEVLIEVVEEVVPKPDIPDRLDVENLRARPLSDLLDLAGTLPIRIPAFAGKSQVIFEILSYYVAEGCAIEAEGILEQAKENFGMLRDPKRSFKTSPDDFYVGSNLIKAHGLRTGQLVRVKLRAPRDRDKFLSALEIVSVEGIPVAEYEEPQDFDQLTSLFPEERFVLECEDPKDLAVRLIDLIAPLGKGSRGLIVAPPRGGKTILLKQIARSIQKNNPETTLIILLLDERPEEVTDFEEAVDAQVFSSTFDEPSKRHAQVSDLVRERARRLVEMGQDVVILLDSLTRLARGYNNSQRGGPIGSGGLSPNALAQSRKFFGAARNVEEGGSLTILATCLVETESRMDDVIFEELKGTGNMEIRLDGDLSERRIYPAIHIPQSGTRNDERLYHPDEMPKVIDLRRQLTGLPVGEAVETLMNQLSNTGSNAEFLLRGLK
jgi:transcription termination factor Rho